MVQPKKQKKQKARRYFPQPDDKPITILNLSKCFNNSIEGWKLLLQDLQLEAKTP